MDGKIRIRQWTSTDDSVTELLAIMSKSHRRQVAASWLEQKLSWRRGGIGALAYSDDTPVGVVLFGASPYEIDGKEVKVALSFDTFVDSSYRKQGLFTRLLRTAEEGCRAAGFELLLNFPNNASRPGFAKHGWKSLPVTRPLIHVSHRNLNAVPRRYLGVIRGRGIPFQPISTEMLDEDDFLQFGDLARPQEGLGFSLSTPSLRYRFARERADGYDMLWGDEFAAILKRGVRGGMHEAQVLVTSPRELSVIQNRRLLRKIHEQFGSDLVTQLGFNRSPISMAMSGYLTLNSRTIPYYKELVPGVLPEKLHLSGIDIHTW